MAIRGLIVASLLAFSHAHCLYSNQPTLKSCVRKCRHTLTAGCVSGCVAGAPYYVRPTCAACLGNGVMCGYRSCYTQCSTGITNSRCTSCISTSCGTCAGAAKAGNETEGLEVLASAFAELDAPKVQEEVAETKEEIKEEIKETQTSEAVNASLSKAGGCWEDKASLKYCGTKCFSQPNKVRCAVRCLRDERHMSAGCAACFGDKVGCTIQKCLHQCMANADGDTCKTCVRFNCGTCNKDKSSSEGSEDFMNAVIAMATSPDQEAALYP
mmetsp:Transcript_31164/g.58473  ORF Transcript_31164/g.58473 Transcript_31164/m.58473 type:complete len:269 (+) Transcript_31164:85-891(+)